MCYTVCLTGVRSSIQFTEEDKIHFALGVNNLCVLLMKFKW